MKDFFQKNHPEFVSLFKGRHVAVVAGGAVVKNWGEKIDACDIVVRINNCHEKFPYPKEFTQKYGTRTDVLIREANDFHHVYATTGDLHGYVKKLREMAIHNIFFFTGNRAAELNFISKDSPKFHCLTPYVFNLLTSCLGQLGKVPSTGLVALTALALSSPASLLVVGFTFYQTGFLDNVNSLNPQILSPELATRFHDFAMELRIFRDFVRKLCPMILSSKLEALL